jgi:hypothetical protein
MVCDICLFLGATRSYRLTMGRGADGDRVYEQGVTRPRERNSRKTRKGAMTKAWTGGAQGRTREGANATIAPPRRISLGNSEG